MDLATYAVYLRMTVLGAENVPDGVYLVTRTPVEG